MHQDSVVTCRRCLWNDVNTLGPPLHKSEAAEQLQFPRHVQARASKHCGIRGDSTGNAHNCSICHHAKEQCATLTA